MAQFTWAARCTREDCGWSAPPGSFVKAMRNGYRHARTPGHDVHVTEDGRVRTVIPLPRPAAPESEHEEGF